MIEGDINLRISQSGLAVNSSPTRNTGYNKKNTPPKPSTPTGETHTGNMIVGSMQDIWGLITSMQTATMKQSKEIKHLALKNQELEPKLQIQETKFQELQETFDKQASIVHDTLATYEVKLTRVGEHPPPNVSGNVGSWASIVKHGWADTPITTFSEEIYVNPNDNEYKEQEKRKINIVIRGLEEQDKE